MFGSHFGGALLGKNVCTSNSPHFSLFSTVYRPIFSGSGPIIMSRVTEIVPPGFRFILFATKASGLQRDLQHLQVARRCNFHPNNPLNFSHTKIRCNMDRSLTLVFLL